MKKRMGIAVGVLAVLTAGIVGGIGVPTVLSILEIERNISDAKTEFNQNLALHRLTRETAANIDKIGSRIGGVAAMSIHEGGELDFVTALETAAEQTGMSQTIALETVNQKDVTPWEREVPLKLHVEGDYVGFLRYLREVERLPYLVAIEQFSVIAQSQSVSDVADGSIAADLQATVSIISSSAPAFMARKEH